MNWFKRGGDSSLQGGRGFFSHSLRLCFGGDCFGMLMGWLFFNYLAAGGELTGQSLGQRVLAPSFGNMNFIFLFMAPLITMRLFAQERREHTLDLLLRSHLGHGQIILAKFLSSLVTVLFLLSLTAVFPLILALSGYSDWPVVLTGYAGVVLCVMCYLAVGVFTSSLTENQILASLASFCILLGVMFVGGKPPMPPITIWWPGSFTISALPLILKVLSGERFRVTIWSILPLLSDFSFI